MTEENDLKRKRDEEPKEARKNAPGQGRHPLTFGKKYPEANAVMSQLIVKIETIIEMNQSLQAETLIETCLKLVNASVKSADRDSLTLIGEEISLQNAKRNIDNEQSYVEITNELKNHKLTPAEKAFKKTYKDMDQSDLSRTKEVLKTFVKDVEFSLLFSEKANPMFFVNSILTKAIRVQEEERSAKFMRAPSGNDSQEVNSDEDEDV